MPHVSKVRSGQRKISRSRPRETNRIAAELSARSELAAWAMRVRGILATIEHEAARLWCESERSGSPFAGAFSGSAAEELDRALADADNAVVNCFLGHVARAKDLGLPDALGAAERARSIAKRASRQ